MSFGLLQYLHLIAWPCGCRYYTDSKLPVLFIQLHSLISRRTLIFYTTVPICGPGSSVGIATDYGLDGLGIESL